MNQTVIWITLGLFVLFYMAIEYVGKRSFGQNRRAFACVCRRGAGEKLADQILKENGLAIEKLHRDSAFDDRFVYRTNQLIISNTGAKSNSLVAVNAVLRETYRAVLFNQNPGKYRFMYLVRDILKTLTLIAVPLFIIGLIFSNYWILFGCLVSFFVLGMYNAILDREEALISNLCNEFALKEKLFDSEGQREFEKLNKVADVAPLFSTFNSIRQINVIFNILTSKSKD